MEGEKLLGQIRWLDLEIGNKVAELERLKHSMVRSPRMKEINVQESKIGLKDDVYVKMIELNDYINERIDQLVDLKRELIEAIDGLDDSLERNILWLRFVERKTWDEIEANLSCTRSRLFIYYRQAIRKIETKLD